MASQASGIYVGHTGHVLAAVSAVGNPDGAFSEEKTADLLASGVVVRLLKPPPSKFPIVVAYRGKEFKFQFPTRLFSKLGEDLALTDSGTPTGIDFDPATAAFSGTLPETGDEFKIDVTAKNKKSNEEMTERFTLRVEVSGASRGEFLVPGSELRLHTEKPLPTAVGEDLFQQPRAYQFVEKEFRLLSNPTDLSTLEFELDSNGLNVSLQNAEPATTDIPIWAFVGAVPNGPEQIKSGVIAREESGGSIGLTIDSSAKYQILLLVAKYDPFELEMGLTSDQESKLSWP